MRHYDVWMVWFMLPTLANGFLLFSLLVKMQLQKNHYTYALMIADGRVEPSNKPDLLVQDTSFM